MPPAPVAERSRVTKSLQSIRDAPRSLLTRFSTRSSAERVLVLLVLAGIALRVVATVSYWPTIPSNADAWPFASYAANDPFGDPQHPAGYSLFLALTGLVTRQVAVVTIVQHSLGIATALLLYAATRRLVGSPWPALLPAAFVLLNADQVYQEQTATSEWLFTALWALGLYATVRAIGTHRRALQWAAGAGLITALAVITRTQAVLLVPVFAAGLLIGAERPRRRHWQTPAVLIVTACAVLGLYGVAKDIDTGRFELGPSPGWQLYAHVAPFADCRLFTPPAGTRGLCEVTPPKLRLGDGHYLYDASSPAVRLFGHIGKSDSKLLAFALADIWNQPGAYLGSVYDIMRDYFVPSTFVYMPGAGDDIDGELDWHVRLDPMIEKATITGMETFFARFNLHVRPRGTQALHDYQRVFRFGATLLTLTALLTLLGLAIGPTRSRAGALLFGIGGLTTLIPQALGGAYIGRYSVPLAGSMAAAASIVLWTLWRMESDRKRNERAVEMDARPIAGVTSPNAEQSP